MSMKIHFSFVTMEKFSPREHSKFQDKAERASCMTNGKWSFFRSKAFFLFRIHSRAWTSELMTLFAFDVSTRIGDSRSAFWRNLLLNQRNFFFFFLRKSSADDGKSLKRHFRCRCESSSRSSLTFHFPHSHTHLEWLSLKRSWHVLTFRPRNSKGYFDVAQFPNSTGSTGNSSKSD